MQTSFPAKLRKVSIYFLMFYQNEASFHPSQVFAHASFSGFFQWVSSEKLVSVLTSEAVSTLRTTSSFKGFHFNIYG
jgi:hypothetical protein